MYELMPNTYDIDWIWENYKKIKSVVFVTALEHAEFDEAEDLREYQSKLARQKAHFFRDENGFTIEGTVPAGTKDIYITILNKRRIIKVIQRELRDSEVSEKPMKVTFEYMRGANVSHRCIRKVYPPEGINNVVCSFLDDTILEKHEFLERDDIYGYFVASKRANTFNKISTHDYEAIANDEAQYIGVKAVPTILEKIDDTWHISCSLPEGTRSVAFIVFIASRKALLPLRYENFDEPCAEGQEICITFSISKEVVDTEE